MTEPTIPPKPVLQVVSSVTPAKSNMPASSPARMLVNDAPVRHAPSALRPKEGHHERIEGRVTGYDRERHEMRIATRRGEITVKSDAALPEDTEVEVELYTKNGVELARIALSKQAAVAENLELPETPEAATAPPLKAGDTVTALLLKDETAEQPQQIAQITLQRVALILEQLSPQELQQLPQPLPVPPDVALKLAMAKDLFQALQQLPPEQRQAIVDYLSRGDVMAKLQTMLPAKTLSDISPQAQTPVTIDENMSQIIQTQSAAKSSLQATPVEGETSSGPLQNPLQGLTSLLETLQSPDPMAGAGLPRLSVAGGIPSNAALLAPLLPQNMYQLKIVSVTPPGQQAPVPQPNAIQGKVEFITSGGFPVVRAGDSHFILRSMASVAVGSTVEFEPSAMSPQQMVATLASSSKTLLPLLSATWPALQEALDGMAATAPEMAAQMQNTIPTASPKLAPTALFFLAALKIGMAESWLGPQVLQTLRDTGKSNLAERLTGDFGKISAQAKDILGGEWKGISMPLLHEGEISQMQFYIRRQHDEREQEKDDGTRTAPTRFILNLHLSRMGDMQLDGLLRKKNFDLILRSAEALPLTMRQELMQSFAKGLAQAEMQGGISFQTRQQSWVTIDLPQQGTVA